MHAPTLAGARLLVAEDEPLIAMDVERLFEEEGATVFAASSVSRSIRLVETSSLSAGVVDIRLGQDHAEPVCETLARHQVPFVFYTAQSDVAWKRWSASPVVSKPATAAAIVGAIKYTLAANKRDLLSSISTTSRSSTSTGTSPMEKGGSRASSGSSDACKRVTSIRAPPKSCWSQ